MMIKLRRQWLTDLSTIGTLQIPGIELPTIYTLEDVVRPPGIKIYGQTAIPAGCYPLVIRESARFRTKLPLLLDVPGFEGIRIHAGNRSVDTDGCILVGLERGTDWIAQSRLALERLMALLRDEPLMHILITTEPEDMPRRKAA